VINVCIPIANYLLRPKEKYLVWVSVAGLLRKERSDSDFQKTAIQTAGGSRGDERRQAAVGGRYDYGGVAVLGEMAHRVSVVENSEGGDASTDLFRARSGRCWGLQ